MGSSRTETIEEEKLTEAMEFYKSITKDGNGTMTQTLITDDSKDMMPTYPSFVRGAVDSDGMPLNVSRDSLQQHRLLKVTKKISNDRLAAFWSEYSTNTKLGVISASLARYIRKMNGKKGYQVLLMSEAVDESAILEFEGSGIDGDTEAARASKEKFEPFVIQEARLLVYLEARLLVYLEARLPVYLEARLLSYLEDRLLSYLRTKLLIYLGRF